MGSWATPETGIPDTSNSAKMDGMIFIRKGWHRFVFGIGAMILNARVQTAAIKYQRCKISNFETIGRKFRSAARWRCEVAE